MSGMLPSGQRLREDKLRLTYRPYGERGNKMTKREQAILKSYEDSSMENLHDAYGKFSKEKADAWERCKELCKRYYGHDLRILGANTFFFSAGFTYTDEFGQKCLMYITHADNKRIVIAKKED